MSLVNDMLRDLDSRRSNTGGTTVSREKLIPATDASRKSAKPSGAAKWLAPLSIVVVAAAGVLVWRMQQVEQIPVPVQSLASVEPVSPALEPRVDQAILQEMERMSLRMQELEERNIALQMQVEQTIPTAEEHAQMPVSQADAIALEPEEGLPELPAALVMETTQPENTNAPVAVENDAALAAAGVSEPSASTLVRMPAQMNFREVDRQQVQDALALWQQGQQGAALESLTAFASANPQAHQSREMLAKLMLQQGEMIGAMEQADIGLAIQPDHYGYKKVKARVLMAAGVPGEAADLLALRAPSLAGDSEYHELLAASRLASQKYTDALVSYQALSASAPLDARWWYGVAAAQDALGSSFEAVQSYERALQLGGLTPALSENSQQRIASIRQN